MSILTNAKDTNEYVIKITEIMEKNIINREVMELFYEFCGVLTFHKESPLQYAMLVHEIGHLDSSMSVGATLGVIMVGKHIYRFVDGSWIYSRRHSFNSRNCVFAYLENSKNEAELSTALIKMFLGGVEFTNHISNIFPKNRISKWYVKRHYNLNSYEKIQTKQGDISVAKRLRKNKSLSVSENDNLKHHFKKFYEEIT